MNHRKFVFTLPIMFVLFAVLSACSQKVSNKTTTPAELIDQANLCEVSAWRYDDVAKLCKPGQKVVYLPESFGNEQLPIIFAAVNCDLTHTVALTKGAVTCIYSPITPKQENPSPSTGKN